MPCHHVVWLLLLCWLSLFDSTIPLFLSWQSSDNPITTCILTSVLVYNLSQLYYCTKIRFFLLQNRQGKTRLSKWYIPPPTTSSSGSSTSAEAEKTRIEAEVHRLVTARDKKYTNFIEYNSYKLIYRRYAGLFFTIAVDVQDNELSYLETIHLFVELLDAYFSNVCELDIVFNFNKVYSILDEFMLAGEMEETSKREILDRVKFMEKME